MTTLSIVVPCLDEAHRLPPSLRGIADYLERQPRWLPAEMIVVDDGSRDGTAAAARAVEMPERVALSILRHDRNRGKGAAVRTGFAGSSGHSVLICDADLATPIEELDVVQRAAGNSRVAFGSRAVDRSKIAVRQPLYRDFMGRTFNLAVRLLTLPGVYDTQCGFKLFPGELARALARVQQMDGFAFDVELLFLARRWGFEIVEVPVCWRHVEASRVRPVLHSSEMIRDVFRLWLRRIGGRLPDRPPNLGGDA